MLELDGCLDLIDTMWESADGCARLPSEWDDYFEQTGLVPSRYDNRRSFLRFFLRARGVVEQGQSVFGVYLKDLSRDGVGFVAPQQFLPLEHLRLLLPGPKSYDIQVVRCRRLGERCYDCGAHFIGELGQYAHFPAWRVDMMPTVQNGDGI